MDIFYKSKIL